MLNVKVNDLDIWNVEELMKEFYIEKNDVIESDIVLEICVGCRGEIDEIKNVEVVDGMFKVNEESEIREIVLKDFDELDLDEDENVEECRENFVEFVCSELFDLNNKKVWLEGWFEESSSYYVRLK